LPRRAAVGRANASRLADAGAAADQPTNARASRANVRASRANASVTDAGAAANQSANTGAPDAGTPNRCPAHGHTRAVTDC
jgi:hypothetical protein